VRAKRVVYVAVDDPRSLGRLAAIDTGGNLHGGHITHSLPPPLSGVAAHTSELDDI
jgi:hypothetical protein